jgi:hypothetical protein
MSSLSPQGHQLGCFWVVQSAVERFIQNGEEVLSTNEKLLLIDLGILTLSEEEIQSKSIVGPFKFNDNGSKETN